MAMYVAMSADVAPCPAPYRVVGPDAPKPHENTAAKELSAYLGRRVAGRLSIGGSEGVVFHVGDTELAKRKGLLSTALPSEKWVVRSFDGDVLLNGGGSRGVLFAVYHFLEDCCGVRWWSEFEEDVPPAGSLALPALDMQGRPAFAFRDVCRILNGADSSLFERRVRLNAHGDAALGGAVVFGPPKPCHTFDAYLPAREHLKAHPEWFSLYNGKRVGGQTTGQLCLTNPEVREEVLKRILANIERGIAASRTNGVEPPRIYDISQNDNRCYCQCNRCSEATGKYGLSGVNLDFVNFLAAEVAKRHSDVMLCTFAYQGTQDVPKGGVRAADNVIVRLCDTASNMAASIGEPCNRAYFDLVADWSGAARHLFVWDYAVTYSHGLRGLPFASEFHYGDLFRHYRSCGVSGIFWEHEFPYMADMWELKFFLETKLMEDPDLDNEKLIVRFMREYYGPAGKYVFRYRRHLDRIRRQANAWVGWYPARSAFGYIGDGDIDACNRMLDSAEASVAGMQKFLARVRRARLGLDQLVCLRSQVVRHEPGGGSVGKAPVRGLDAARDRLLNDWPRWCEAFPNGNALVRKRLAVLSDALVPGKGERPVPEWIRGRGYYDFPAQTFWSLNDWSLARLVEDRETPVGWAMRSEADKGDLFKLPFAAGVYDKAAKKSCARRDISEVKGDGYHWYRIGRLTMPENRTIWFTRAWNTLLDTRSWLDVDLTGRDLEMWVSVKFTGPMFRPCKGGRSFIWIDRVMFVDPQRGGVTGHERD